MKTPYPQKLVGWLIGLFTLHICFFEASAQTTLSGMVTDASSSPLMGVSIQVKGKVVGTTTDSDGRFTLRVQDRPPLTLIATCIGYLPQEVIAETAGTEMNFQMKKQ